MNRAYEMARMSIVLGSVLLILVIQPAPLGATAFSVPAAAPWTDTGIDVVAGQTLEISASGLVCFGGCSRTVNPDGVGDGGNRDGTQKFPGTVLPDAIGLSVIGKVGGTTAIGTGTPVPEGGPGKGAGFVGSAYSQVVPVSGRLFLGFNDDFFGDNSGEFSTEITLSDVTDPTVAITTPPDDAVYALGQVVLADYACADEAGGSGLASCLGNVADGSGIDTASVGPKTFTVEARDNGGNTGAATHDYSVVYDFSGFFPPVDNLPTLNAAKAGRAVPVKLSLTGFQGLDIFAASYPRSQAIICGSDAPVDGVEETVTAGSSSLSYDGTLDQYVYVWKTEKSWAGTCRQLVVKLDDGTFHRANFLLR